MTPSLPPSPSPPSEEDAGQNETLVYVFNNSDIWFSSFQFILILAMLITFGTEFYTLFLIPSLL